MVNAALTAGAMRFILAPMPRKFSAAERPPELRRLFAMSSMADIARALGISRQAVCMWRRVPHQHVLALEKLLSVPRQELRPDIFGGEPVRRPKSRTVRAADQVLS